jgi:signal transduction histidine kinase
MAMDDPLTEQKARRQELLAALGPAVQHAANNMLTVLGGTADILRRTAADEAGAKRADRVTDATRRLETLIRAYVTVARRPVPDNEPADAALLLGRLAPLIELSLPRGDRTRPAPAAP